MPWLSTGCSKPVDSVSFPKMKPSTQILVIDDNSMAIRQRDEEKWWYYDGDTNERGFGYSDESIVRRFDGTWDKK